MNKYLTLLKNNVLLMSIVLMAILGIATGFSLRSLNLNETQIALIGFPGEIFMRMLLMVVFPLVVCSIVTGLATLDIRTSRQIFAIAFSYFIVTTFLATMMGILIAALLQPGKYTSTTTVSKQYPVEEQSPLDAIMDLLRNAFPDNIVQATFQQARTELVMKNLTDLEPERKVNYVSGMNVLGIIMMSVTLGILLGRLGEEGKMLSDLIIIIDEITMKLVELTMWYSPFGICSLITGKLLEVDNEYDTLKNISAFIIIVVCALLVQTFIILPIVYFILTHKNPMTFLDGLTEALLTAFVTSSSAAALPYSIQCCERKRIDHRVIRFVLPVGSIFNMNGSSLYQAMVALFIAQINNIDVSLLNIIVISIISTIGSMSSSSMPHAACLTTIIVLRAVSLPVSDISILLAVDWLLDRFQTLTNVMGDLYGAGIVNHFCKKELEQQEIVTSKIKKSDSDAEMKGEIAKADLIKESKSKKAQYVDRNEGSETNSDVEKSHKNSTKKNISASKIFRSERGETKDSKSTENENENVNVSKQFAEGKMNFFNKKGLKETNNPNNIRDGVKSYPKTDETETSSTKTSKRQKEQDETTKVDTKTGYVKSAVPNVSEMDSTEVNMKSYHEKNNGSEVPGFAKST